MNFLYLKNVVYKGYDFKMLIIVPNTNLVIQTYEEFLGFNNGKDTHRTWNAIAFGCIPIVEKSNKLIFGGSFLNINGVAANRFSKVGGELAL
jgi:hypothetical protein